MHSGQHYDDELSAVFFRELGVPAPDHELRVGSAPDGEQIGRIMHAFEPVAADARADIVLVYGDTNTTLAGALACRAPARSRWRTWRPGCARSIDSMPEERNRVLTDHLSDLLLCSTGPRSTNLGARRASSEGVELVGDVMADVALAMAPLAATDVRRWRRELGRGAGSVPARHRAPGGQRRRPGGAWPAGGDARGAAAAGGLSGPSAHARAARGCRRARAARSGTTRSMLTAAARVPRLPRAAAGSGRGGDRLGRRAEGGLPGRHALRHLARHDRVDGDGRAGLEPARRPRLAAGAGGAGRPPAPRFAAGAVRRRPCRRQGGRGARALGEPRLPSRL